MLFEERDHTEPYREPTHTDARAVATIAFLDGGIRDHAPSESEEVLTRGIRRAERGQDRKALRATLKGQYSETTTEEMMRKLDEGESLSEEKRGYLLDKLDVVDRLEAARSDAGHHVGP